MGVCEICGRIGEVRDAVVEGAMVQVCSRCSKHGNVVFIPKPVALERKKEVESFEYIDVIVDNYSSLIKDGREKKGLNHEELAKAIAEKESVISQVEAGNMKPNFKLAKKLAVFLNIELIENVESSKEGYKNINFKDSSLTIGDLLKKE
ncbi:TIGR00270 family protein [Candidatus Woesearchaeota archaeon]|nr:TIGR00270 family protein [Candidatus Woesearchaeota archaeon]